jgi:hypothetical protein
VGVDPFLLIALREPETDDSVWLVGHGQIGRKRRYGKVQQKWASRIAQATSFLAARLYFRCP